MNMWRVCLAVIWMVLGMVACTNHGDEEEDMPQYFPANPDGGVTTASSSVVTASSSVVFTSSSSTVGRSSSAVVATSSSGAVVRSSSAVTASSSSTSMVRSSSTEAVTSSSTSVASSSASMVRSSSATVASSSAGMVKSSSTTGISSSNTMTSSSQETTDDWPVAGNPNPEAQCAIPSGGGLEDVSSPRTVVGNGTPASCTSAAFVSAVAAGGVITFNCGPTPHTITLEQTAKIFNNTGPRIVIDGGGRITLDGANARRILYMNTCDGAQVWTTDHCNNQDHPQLTVQNLTFINGNASHESNPGGGAIYVFGGRFKAVHSRFFNNRGIDVDQDEGGGAVRVLHQHDHANQPAFITGCTFGGREALANHAASGGGLSGLFASFTVTNTLFTHNRATGYGGNPGHGGNGGGIYMDGMQLRLNLCGTRLEYNHTNAYGRAIFFVSNDHQGILTIDRSVISNNIDDNTDGNNWSWDVLLPGVAMHEDTNHTVTNSTITG